MPSSSNDPIDATPITLVPAYEMVPFGEEYVIREEDEENSYVSSSEPIDEEIEVDVTTSPPQASSP